MTKVLIADKLSPAAVDIFKARGIETDIKVGLSKDELIEIIPQYDGLAVRSACKPNADVIAAGSVAAAGWNSVMPSRVTAQVARMERLRSADRVADGSAGRSR